MIVDCLSCGATYNISDEKVRGRRVRVRCKSCGEGIIVDGMRVETEDATRVYAPNFEPAAYSAGRDEATRVMTASATAGLNEAVEDDEWTVNISETEQRNMRLEEIVSGYGSGLVDDNAYVWKDGMADWVPLREISEIRAALEYVETTRVVSPSALKPPQAQRPSPMPPKAPYSGVETPRIPSAPPPPMSTPAAMAPPSAPPVAVNVPAAVPTQTGGFPVPPPPSVAPPPPSARAKVTYSAPAPPPRPFVRGPEPAASVEYKPPELSRPVPPPAKVRETRQRADLFGGSSAAGSEDELLRSESVPLSAYDEKPTGARNESSVLFSLDTLKAGARRGTPSSAPPRAAAAAPPTAADILGMAATGPSALPSAPSLLSAPAVSARPAPPPPPPPPLVTEHTVPRARMDTTPPTSRLKPKTGLLVAAVVVGAVVVAGAAALVFKDRCMTPKPLPEAEAKPAPTVAPPKPPEPAASPEPPTTAVATTQPAPPPVETTAPAPEKPPAREPETKHAVAPRPASPAPAPKAERTPPAGDDSEALKAAIRTEEKPAKEPATEKVVLAEETTETPEAPAAPPEEAAKPPFDTTAAKAALASAASGVGGCKKPFNPTGSGRIQVTFSPSGKATAATFTEGSFDGTPVGACVAKLFRGARVPAFSGDPVTVAKSFTIPE